MADGRKQTTLQQPVIQRAVRTEGEANAALAPAINAVPHIFMELVDPELATNRNCHGYTIHGDTTHEEGEDALLAQFEGKGPIRVFVRDGRIAHSGRIIGGRLIHYVIGIGLLSSETSPETLMGYTASYTLPEQEDALRIAVNKPKPTTLQLFAEQKIVAKMNIEERISYYQYDADDYDPDDTEVEVDEVKKEAYETMQDWKRRLVALDTMEYSPQNMETLHKWNADT